MTVNTKKAVPKDLIDSLLADYKKPEDLIGESMWTIRFFGLVLLTSAVYFFSLQFLRLFSIGAENKNYGQIGAAAFSCTTVNFNSALSTLYRPSCNLLNLVLIFFSTGLLSHLFREFALSKLFLAFYRLCMGAVLFPKFSSFFAELLAHLFVVPAP